MKRAVIALSILLVGFALFVQGIASGTWKTKEQMIEEGVHPYRFICLTPEEYTLFAHLVMGEQGSELEPHNGRVAVAKVVLNRILDDDFPDNLTAVICQRGQFSAYPSCLYNQPTEDCYKAIDEALMGEGIDVPFKVLYFSTDPQGREVWAKLGGHYFCY